MNKVEWQGEVELDMQELVEVMTEVQVGRSVDWAMCPDSIDEVWFMDLIRTYKFPTVACVN